jgi:hypothetical protein
MVAISWLCFGEGGLSSNLNLVILRIAGSIRGAVGGRSDTVASPRLLRARAQRDGGSPPSSGFFALSQTSKLAQSFIAEISLQ